MGGRVLVGCWRGKNLGRVTWEEGMVWAGGWEGEVGGIEFCPS